MHRRFSEEMKKKKGGRNLHWNECAIRDLLLRSFDNDYTNDTGAFHSRLIEATFCSFNYDKTKFPPLIISPVPRVSPSLSLYLSLSSSLLALVRARLINRRPRLYYARPPAPNTGIEAGSPKMQPRGGRRRGGGRKSRRHCTPQNILSDE